MSQRDQNIGFTLIELMIVVAIIGVLAAIAIPGFAVFLRRSKASEASQMLNNVFKSASAFYTAERTSAGITATTTTSCLVPPTSMSPATPNDDKQVFTAAGGFALMGFSVADYVYFGYGISSIGSADVITCLRNGANTETVYTFYAHGDLDGDGLRSTFELAVGADENDQLYHARGFYVAHEIE